MTVGVGIVTCDRPLYFEQCYESLWIRQGFHKLVVVDDGSEPTAQEVLKHRNWGCKLIRTKGRTGVGHAKNLAAQKLMEWGCDWLFLVEDDITATSSDAIRGYIRACEASGWQHLMFHGHGPMNPLPYGSDPSPAITMWPQCVGAWCIYSRKCFAEVGYFDERLPVLEHVEQTIRCAVAGFTPMPHGFADATGSENWLKEIKGSYENSTISKKPFDEARAIWEANNPETYHILWPPN